MLIQTITRWKAYSNLAREKQISHSHSTVKEATLTAHLWWSIASCWDVRQHHWAELTVEWNRTGALPEQFWEQANLKTDTENEQSLVLIYYSALMWNRVFKAHSNAESQKDLIRWRHSWQAATWLLLTTGSSIILFLSEFYFYDKTRKQRREMVPFKF